MSDTGKDIQRTDEISTFLNGHSTRFSSFGKNRIAERAYRRAERISAAIFLLTEHIQGLDSTKDRIRNESIELMAGIVRAKDQMRQADSQAIGSLLGSLRILSSMTKMLAVSKAISTQNAGVVVEAIDELGSVLSSAQKSALSEQIVLSKDELTDIGRMPVTENASPNKSHNKPIKDRESIKDNHEMSYTKRSQTVDGGDGVRARNILSILRSGGSLGIKDIAAGLPEYSEKMIQRELLVLVASGKVSKIGLKRWSKYSLPE